MAKNQELPPEAQKWLDGKELLLNKPYGWTSFDLVKKVRYGLRNRYGIRKIKVGHAGTLDPLATGLMIICTGRSTKKLVNYQELGKSYLAGIRLGATTPSFDLETEIDQTFDYEHVTPEIVREALKSFMGSQQQIPPQFSAKKIEGKRAYDLAREGLTAEIKPQSIEIYDISLVNYEFPDITVSVSCSKGTYIRSIARDLGEKLNTGGHLISLIRTSIGEYKLSDALEIDDLENIFDQM
jgi:tRNA pseudouridine55 synthase